MATNPTNFRFPFEPHIAKLEPQVQYVVRNLWNSINDAQNAVPILKAQIDANTTSIAANTTSINNSTASQTVVPPSPQTIGFVNSQVGNTTYSTTQEDYGAFILLNDASPIAVTLTSDPSIQLPWETSFLNLGVGLATLTPATGTINGLASLTLPQNGYVTVSFDGTNFWLGPPPQIITKGGTVLNPTAPINVIVWFAPYSFTITNVLGYTSGSTGSVINAQRNGTLPLLVSNLTLGSANTWTDGGAVQNTAVSIGDKLEIMIVSVSGTPTQISVEIQGTRP
jgi:hypothetical protein